MAKGRFFTPKEKLAVAYTQGADPGMQADHIEPHYAGGSTDVANCQLLTALANQEKGGSTVKLREWQQEMIHTWTARRPGKPFLLVAIPGGGKTVAALTAAYQWLRAAADRRLLVVVPSRALVGQWRAEAAKFGIQLKSKDLVPAHEYNGHVTTYSTVANNRLHIRSLVSRSPTLVIFDEMHHCGDDQPWGAAIFEACELCSEKLMLSGTPFRTDGRSIPFVTYDGDGYSVADFRYDYPQALNDDVVRWLVFAFERGSADVTQGTTPVTYEVTGETSEDEASAALRRVLHPDGDFVRALIGAAHRRLEEVRLTVDDAAGMVACIDTWHAQKIARVIKEVTGSTPEIVVSDEEAATSSVEQFRKGKAKWLVSVRQVSEGVDIKRLQVLCYLTNCCTPLFFRQLIGRVSRTRGLEDQEGYVFLPADPRLIDHAKNIEDAQLVAKRAYEDELRDELRQRDATESGDEEIFHGSTADGLEVGFIANVRYPAEEFRKISLTAERAGVSLEKVAAVLSAWNEASGQPPDYPVIDQSPMPLEEREQSLRRRANGLAFRLSKNRNCKPQDIHMLFAKRQDRMSIAELTEKIASLERMIASE